MGERITAARLDEGLTQAELAERASLSPAAVSRIEAGTRRPGLEAQLRLAAALRRTHQDLFAVDSLAIPA